jgi:hypothetical protein
MLARSYRCTSRSIAALSAPVGRGKCQREPCGVSRPAQLLPPRDPLPGAPPHRFEIVERPVLVFDRALNALPALLDQLAIQGILVHQPPQLLLSLLLAIRRLHRAYSRRKFAGTIDVNSAFAVMSRSR